MRPPRLHIRTNQPPKRKRRIERPPTPPPNEYDSEQTPEPAK